MAWPSRTAVCTVIGCSLALPRIPSVPNNVLFHFRQHHVCHDGKITLQLIDIVPVRHDHSIILKLFLECQNCTCVRVCVCDIVMILSSSRYRTLQRADNIVRNLFQSIVRATHCTQAMKMFATHTKCLITVSKLYIERLCESVVV